MFEGLKIVELASVLAGPLTGTFFSELGAEVVKIENINTGGDVTRNWKLAGEDKNASVSAYYAAANYNKKSIFLDYKNPSDFDKTLSFIKTADIVIANFKPGDAEKLHLSYADLKKINPGLIYAEINGFGESNQRVAFDVVLQAESGFMYMNGEKNAKPLKMPVALIDILAAHQLKEGILCALIQKLKTGKGCKVSVSLYDAALASLANQATNWLMNGQIPTAIGSQHPNIAPYGDMYVTKDEKWIVLAVGSEKQFAAFCKAIGKPELVTDEKYCNNQLRVANRDLLNKLTGTAIAEKDSVYWQNTFTQLNIPFGLVKNMQEVFADETARQLILEETIDGLQTKRTKTVVFKIQGD